MLMEAENENMVLAGNDVITTVTIIDNEKPGIIGFKEAVVNVRPMGEHGCGTVDIVVKRSHGADGEVSCTYNTCLDHYRLMTLGKRQQA